MSPYVASGAIQVGDQIELYAVLWNVVALDGIAGEVRLKLVDESRSQFIEIRKRTHEPLLLVEKAKR